MEKVTFKAEVKVPGKKKLGAVTANPDASLIALTIKGMFNAKEALVLESLLKSWHRNPKK